MIFGLVVKTKKMVLDPDFVGETTSPKYEQHEPTPRILYKMCLHPGPITKSKSCPNKWCLYKIATQPQDAGQHHFTTKSGTTMDMLLNPQIRLYKKKVCTGGYRLRFCRGNWWGDKIYVSLLSSSSSAMVTHV